MTEKNSKTSASFGASYPESRQVPLLVSTATAAEYNTIRSKLIPKACYRLEDSNFEFDSSFVTPLTFDAEPLKLLLDKHKGFKLSIFGHTDPVGRDDYNKTLSGRRAQSIYALLTRNVKLWSELYYDHDIYTGKDEWGVRSVQTMLNLLQFLTGRADGVLDERTKTKLKEFEKKNELPVKGFNAKKEIAPATFEKLASLYMDAICTDEKIQDFRLTPNDFLARGKGKDGKGDFQGCSEFNPLLIFSKADAKRLDKPEKKKDRDKKNQPNRRVMVLLYHPEAQVDPARWPCPSVKEGVSGCLKRFHSDADERRSNLAQQREHKDEKQDPDMVGTFACRFYDIQTGDSPCESGSAGENWIRLVVMDSQTGEPIPDVALVVRSAAGLESRATTDAAGEVFVEGLAPGPVEVESAHSDSSHLPHAVTFVGMGPPKGGVETGKSTKSFAPAGEVQTGSRNVPRSIMELVNSEPEYEAAVGASDAKTQPFKRSGLAADQLHHIRVAPLDAFFFFLKDEDEFPIPEAEYEITLADLSQERGRLDRKGMGMVLHPPEGPFEIRYTDLDDVKAKSVAAKMRKACEAGDYQTTYRLLLYSPTLLELADARYRQYFNDLSGKGMAEDIQDSIKDPDLLQGIQAMMSRAGLPTRVAYRFREIPRNGGES